MVKIAKPTLSSPEKEMLSRLYAPASRAAVTTPVALSCDVCQEVGSNSNMVSCDECRKFYHFTCLDPPLKKSPKKRGYSWHCADCDPTVSIPLF